MEVFWSDRLELLADGLFKRWDESPGDPFARTCVVVGDMATRNWLRDYFLLHRRGGRRRVLANIDFKPLAEFANDWLAAMTHARNGEPRRAKEHPYSQNVLAWRIDAILRDCRGDPEFKVLDAYVGNSGGRAEARRRHDLAVRLAQLYDDYLGSRYRMLVNWSRGILPRGAARWQAVLYNKLAAECPQTYTADFDAVLRDDADPSAAFARGFPKYTAIHVFDVPSAPWPYLLMLGKISGTLPVAFWNFNPSRDFWLEDKTRREAMRERIRAVKNALEGGENPPQENAEAMFGTPDQKLLGSLATGTRGLLAAELDLAEGNCEWIGPEDEGDFTTLRAVRPEVHACHTPRRELEAAKDALCRFFKETPDARPGDALVLCADWSTYSPLIESVFAEGEIPVCSEGGIHAETPISHSFGDLLAFRANRFEASAVFALLGVPAIRDRFEIGADGLTTLREMVRNANIRWGYDDADVRETLGLGDDSSVWHFTWRRGLDRFIADALLGDRDDSRAIADLGAAGRLLPCGLVEGERARLIGRLDAFATALEKLRGFLRVARSADEWREGLLKAVGDFYLDDGENAVELARLREAVVSTASDALNAQKVAGRVGEKIEGEIFCRALLSSVSAGPQRLSSVGDAVRFAPLGAGTAMPARFVWICGLNDGSFPSSGCRPSFDLVGSHPSLFDVDPRERDTFALLKAAMGARDRLAFSYLGRNARTNEELPAAVPLLDLLDWFRASGVAIGEYQHPLQSYSASYYAVPKTLPPHFSEQDRAAAESLLANAETGLPLSELVPFAFADEGETVIDVEDLVAFYGRPQRFLANRKLGLRLFNPKYDVLSDDDSSAAEISAHLRSEVLLASDSDVGVRTVESERMVEEGAAPDAGMAEAELETQVGDEAIEKFQSKVVDFAKKDRDQDDFACPGEPLAKRYLEFRGQDVQPYSAVVEVEGRRVRLEGWMQPPVLLKARSGKDIPHVFEYREKKFARWDAAASVIRHLARQVAGKGCVTIRLSPDDSPKTLRPLPQNDAKARLSEIVRLAMQPLAVDIRTAAGAGDELPGEYGEAVDDYDFCFFKGKKWNRTN